MVLVSFHKEMHTQPCGTEYSFLSEGWALWYLFLFINKCTPSPLALIIPFTQIVRLMVLVSFQKHMHRRVHLMVLVSFHKHMHRCTPSPVALNFPFTQIMGLMVLVSFHK